MDFIKVLNRHTMFEYNDLTDSEFRAWIKIMSLTAYLEQEPTREQMLHHVHYKTLDSLQCKLNTRSIDLQYIVNKVLMDVQCVANRRESWKNSKKRLRTLNNDVLLDVPMDVHNKRREREEIDIEKRVKRGFHPPPLADVSAYCLERKNTVNPQTFINHYESNGWMVGKNKMKDWKAAVRNWETRGGDYAGRTRISSGGPGDLPTPPEWKGDAPPVISDAERISNIRRLRELMGQGAG